MHPRMWGKGLLTHRWRGCEPEATVDISMETPQTIKENPLLEPLGTESKGSKPDYYRNPCILLVTGAPFSLPNYRTNTYLPTKPVDG